MPSLLLLTRCGTTVPGPLRWLGHVYIDGPVNISPVENTTATRPNIENMVTHLFRGQDDALSADSQNLKHFHMSFNLIGNASMMQFVALGVMHCDLNAVVQKTRGVRQHQHHVNFVSRWCYIQPVSSRHSESTTCSDNYERHRERNLLYVTLYVSHGPTLSGRPGLANSGHERIRKWRKKCEPKLQQ